MRTYMHKKTQAGYTYRWQGRLSAELIHTHTFTHVHIHVYKTQNGHIMGIYTYRKVGMEEGCWLLFKENDQGQSLCEKGTLEETTEDSCEGTG